MTTAIRNTTTTPLGIDHRLDLVAAGMDALVSHRHDISDAHLSATAAIDEAREILADMDTYPFPPNKVLAAAASLIRVLGWHRGSWRSEDGAVCALRAIRTISMHDEAACRDAEVELLNRIAAECGDTLSIPMWNDRQTNVADVLKLLY